MAVRFGPGAWPGLISIKLYDEELVPVCSPAFRGGRLPRAPGDLLKMPLLHDERQPWSIWFKAVGLDYRDAGQGPRYGEQTLLLAAAIAGLGVALARASFVQADLESGRLVRLFSQSARTSYSYFIVYPSGSENTGKIQVFQEWLLEQVRLRERKGAIGARAAKGVAGRTLRLVRRRGLINA
jgi:LysR family glycine cleavage system transcriptional activator